VIPRDNSGSNISNVSNAQKGSSTNSNAQNAQKDPSINSIQSQLGLLTPKSTPTLPESAPTPLGITPATPPDALDALIVP
jgi:hypothetical protein